MSEVKAKILGAVTVMSEEEATNLWKIIIKTFSSWESIEEVAPDEIDAAMLEEIKNNPQCKQFVANDEAMRELGL